MYYSNETNKNHYIENSFSDDSSIISASFFLKKDKTKNSSEFKEEPVIKSQNFKSQQDSLKEKSYFDDFTTKPLDTLGKFKQLENQIKLRSENKLKVWESISDIDISTDDEIKHELMNIKELRPIDQIGSEHSKKRVEAFKSSKHTLTVSSSIPSVTEIFNSDKNQLKKKKIPLPMKSKNKPKITSVMKKRPNESKKSVSFDLDSHFNSKNDDISLDSFMSDSVSSKQSLTNTEEINQTLEDRKDSTSKMFVTKNSVGGRELDFLDTKKLPKSTKASKDEKKVVVKNDHRKTSASLRDSSTLETTSNSASVISTYSDVISSKTDVSKSDTLKYTDTIFTEIAEKHSRSRTGSFSSFKSQTTTVTSNDSYSEDFESATSTKVSNYSNKDSKIKNDQENSKLFEKLKYKVLKEVQTQTDAIKVSKHYPSKPFESFQINSLSSTVMPDKHLTAITSYSPAAIALHDVLKQQLLLTRDFIMRSNDLYEYALRQIKTNKNYTTLEMTEKIIQQHRIKLGIAK